MGIKKKNLFVRDLRNLEFTNAFAKKKAEKRTAQYASHQLTSHQASSNHSHLQVQLVAYQRHLARTYFARAYRNLISKAEL